MNESFFPPFCFGIQTPNFHTPALICCLTFSGEQPSKRAASDALMSSCCSMFLTFLSYYPCLQPPIIAYEETKKVNGAVVSHRATSSLSIPINISSLSGTSGYICFEFPEVSFPSNATELTFSVSSNRGKVFEKKLPLGRPLH